LRGSPAPEEECASTALIDRSYQTRNYKKLDREVQTRIETTVKDLTERADPRKAGHGLRGRWESMHSFEVGRRYRLVYKVDFEEHAIQLIAVGTHKIYRE